jgi:hypothetical protein
VVTARRLAAAAVAGSVLAVAGGACKPNLNQTVSIVTTPRILAVVAEPAEAQPGGAVKYSALYADASGTIAMPAIDWTFCDAREPLAELGPVNPKCVEPGSADWFQPIGVGDDVPATMPSTACQTYGPDVPPVMMGMPQPRPVDADPTGGYYQPVRVTSPDGAITLGETRISCGAGGAPALVGVDFQHRYHLNVNPAVASLVPVAADGSPGAPFVTAEMGTNPVPANARVALRASWVDCPATDTCGDGLCGPDETSLTCMSDCAKPVGCTGAERYVRFDIQSQSLVVVRESITVAWFATGGSYDADATGRDSTDPTPSTDNAWHAPGTPGPVHLWVVLTDARGGTGWSEYVFDVQ